MKLAVCIAAACVALLAPAASAAYPPLTPHEARVATRGAIERTTPTARRVNVECFLTSATRARCNLLWATGARRYAGTARIVRRGRPVRIVDHYWLRAHGMARGRRRVAIDERGSVVTRPTVAS